MTRAEAIDVLTQCRLLRESVDALCAKADQVLAKPPMRVVKDEKEFHEWLRRDIPPSK